MKNAIKAIIFDLGGVLLNIDYQKTISEFEKLGFQSFDKQFSQEEQSRLFKQFERGEISEEQLFAKLREKGPANVTDQQMKSAWNSMLLNFPDQNLKFLIQAGKNYRTFLLSNTNETHLKAFNKILQQEHDTEALDNFFEKAYYSHLTGMRKPEKQIFTRVLSENNLKAEETLFIDDTEQHLDSAKELGIQTFLKKQGTDWQDLIDQFNLKLS